MSSLDTSEKQTKSKKRGRHEINDDEKSEETRVKYKRQRTDEKSVVY